MSATSRSVEVGQRLPGGWTVASIEARQGRVRFALHNNQARAVIGFAAARPGDQGAWMRDGVRGWYERNTVGAEAFDEAARFLLHALGDAPAEGIERWLADHQPAPTRAPVESHASNVIPAAFPPERTELAGGWTVAATTLRDGRVHVDVRDESNASTTLRLWPDPAENGPFGRRGVAITHASFDGADGWAERLAAASDAWLDHLASSAPEVSVADLLRAALLSPSAAGLATAHRRLVVRQRDADAAVDRATALLGAIEPALNEATVLATDLPTDDPRISALRDEAAARGIHLTVAPIAAGDRSDVRIGERSDIPSELELTGAERPEVKRRAVAPDTSDWRTRLRAELVGQPEKSMTLGEILPPELVPKWPCALPWVRFEVSPNGWYGPCCRDYQALHSKLPRTALPATAWNGPSMQAFREAMRGDGHPRTCRASCPFLHAGNQRPADVRIPGGPLAAIDNAILAIEDMMQGATVMRAGPMELCLAATTFCNYDCVMCDYGVTGTLDDELPAAFWEGLRKVLGSVFFLEVNGGEPLASPAFRSFLGTLDAATFPQLRILLITNGSYLTPKQLRRYANVPFENITVSVNAASPATYEAVNRGLPWARARSHLDAIAAARTSGELRGRVQYSFVVLRQNVHEIEAFADLAASDGAAVRYQLPLKDRNASSVMTDNEAMRDAMIRLERVGKRLLERNRIREARGALGSAQVLFERLAAGIIRPL